MLFFCYTKWLQCRRFIIIYISCTRYNSAYAHVSTSFVRTSLLVAGGIVHHPWQLFAPGSDPPPHPPGREESESTRNEGARKDSQHEAFVGFDIFTPSRHYTFGTTNTLVRLI